VKLALILAAHSDPALDELFPHRGPCGICGTPGLGARHRVIDSATGYLAEGEDAETVAGEFGLTAEAVAVLVAWMAKWAGAWR
jgi:hypothetical protein